MDLYSVYGSGSKNLLNTDPIRIRIHNTDPDPVPNCRWGIRTQYKKSETDPGKSIPIQKKWSGQKVLDPKHCIPFHLDVDAFRGPMRQIVHSKVITGLVLICSLIFSSCLYHRGILCDGAGCAQGSQLGSVPYERWRQMPRCGCSCRFCLNHTRPKGAPGLYLSIKASPFPGHCSCWTSALSSWAPCTGTWRTWCWPPWPSNTRKVRRWPCWCPATPFRTSHDASVALTLFCMSNHHCSPRVNSVDDAYHPVPAAHHGQPEGLPSPTRNVNVSYLFLYWMILFFLCSL